MNGAGGYNRSSVYIRKLVRQQPHLAALKRADAGLYIAGFGLRCGGSDAVMEKVNKSEAR